MHHKAHLALIHTKLEWEPRAEAMQFCIQNLSRNSLKTAYVLPFISKKSFKITSFIPLKKVNSSASTRIYNSDISLNFQPT